MNLDRVLQLLGRMRIRHIDPSKGQVPFILNPNQLKAHQIVTRNQELGKPHRYIVLKSRRVGMSSYFDGIGTVHCMDIPNANGLILAHTQSSSKELFRIPLGLVESLPFKLSPPPTKGVITFPFKTGDSKMSIATAGHQTTGRGWTLSFLHLSEAAFYPAEAAFSSLLPAVSKSPATWTVIESTANGTEYEGEAFYNFWGDAVEGANEFTPIFLSWLDDPTSVRDPLEMEGQKLDDEEQELVKQFKATLAQLAWRRSVLSTECQGRVEMFHQEYPHTPEVAFISSGAPAFDAKEINYARSTLREPIFVGRIEFTGDFNKPVLRPAPTGPFYVWHKPERDLHYYIGADAARGEEHGDYAAMVIWCGETGEQCLRVEARINPEILAEWCNNLGRWYNNAMVNVELTGNLGLEAQRRLRDDYRYPVFYRWKGARDDRIGHQEPRKTIGWETSTRSREYAFTVYRASLREEHLVVHDKVLLQQMSRAVEKWGSWKVERGHDDVLFAALIGWVARVQYPPPSILTRSGSVLPEDLQLPGDRPNPNDHAYAGRLRYNEGRFAEECAKIRMGHHIERLKRHDARRGLPQPLEGV